MTSKSKTLDSLVRANALSIKKKPAPPVKLAAMPGWHTLQEISHDGEVMWDLCLFWRSETGQWHHTPNADSRPAVTDGWKYLKMMRVPEERHVARNTNIQFSLRPRLTHRAAIPTNTRAANHHWLELIDCDESGKVVLLQWAPGAKAWQLSGQLGSPSYVDVTYMKWLCDAVF